MKENDDSIRRKGAQEYRESASLLTGCFCNHNKEDGNALSFNAKK